MDDRTRGLLINLIEEAAEVSQIAAKCIRFGMDSYDPTQKLRVYNDELLALEIGNFKHIVQRLIETEIINEEIITEGREKKKSRLEKYALIISDIDERLFEKDFEEDSP
jgi:hypothetical protein